MKSFTIKFGIVLAILLLVGFMSCKKETPKVIPTVTLTAATNITANTASAGGKVSADGGATVTARGVYWSSTNATPTISDSKTSDGTGTGSFSSSLSGLRQGTTYNIIAYATNSVGTGYSSASTFKTLALASTLTTTDPSSITTTSFNSGGNITNDGGSSVTARGVCWGINQNPTLTDSKTSDGTGTGIFTSSVTGLAAGTTYYIRAYATNGISTAFGNQVTTKTLAVVPTLTTTTVSSITSTTATSGGNITSDGGASVTARGVCWSTTTSPTTASRKTSDNNGNGSFTSSITELNANTTYYVRAYAINSAGIAYGSEISFKTAIIVTNGLVAYFPFNGNANDESGNGNHGIVFGASLTNDKFGNPNRAYQFTNSFIEANIPNIPINNTPRTITGWFKTNTPNFIDFESCIVNYGTLKTLERFSLCIYPKGYLEPITGSEFSNDYDYYVNNYNYLNNMWYFFSLIYDGTKISLYVNGTDISPMASPTRNAITLKTSNNIFRIGRRILGDSKSDFFDGIIDEIRIYNRELSEQEISALYQEYR